MLDIIVSLTNKEAESIIKALTNSDVDIDLREKFVDAIDLAIHNSWDDNPSNDPLIESENNKLMAITKSAVEIFATNINWKHVPDFKLHELKKKTGAGFGCS